MGSSAACDSGISRSYSLIGPIVTLSHHSRFFINYTYIVYMSDLCLHCVSMSHKKARLMFNMF